MPGVTREVAWALGQPSDLISFEQDQGKREGQEKKEEAVAKFAYSRQA